LTIIQNTGHEETFFFDSEDEQKVQRYLWHVQGDGDDEGRVYAASFEAKITLHRYINDTPENRKCRFLDKDTHNCRKSNLKASTDSEIMQERKIVRKGPQSGFPFIRWSAEHDYWHTSIWHNQKEIWIGGFDNVKDAVIAQEKKRAELRG
jgi:hypothetical protein